MVLPLLLLIFFSIFLWNKRDRKSAEMVSSSDEIVIAVMGVTGSGKSTFIQAVTGNTSIYVAHGLESGTSEVQSYKFTHKGKKYILVDTPGFNDHTTSDEDIMTRVLSWMEKSFRSGTRLNGLLYMHRIIDPKMQGSALSNMRMFRQLCGPGCFPNIILATTFWGDVSVSDGVRRERELKTKQEFWYDLVKKGSQVVRLGKGREEGLKVLEMFRGKGKVTLQGQEEMVNGHKSAKETAAAQAVNADLVKQKKIFEEKLRQEQLMAEKKLAMQKKARREQLARERRIQQEKEERAERERIVQKEATERRWRVQYEENQKRLQAERDEQIRTRREAERVERERKQAEEAREAEEAERREKRAAFYRNYECENDGDFASVNCDKCQVIITVGNYYHCCFCYGDNYDQCSSCGMCCPVYEHPLMKQRYQRYHAPKQDTDCLVM